MTIASPADTAGRYPGGSCVVVGYDGTDPARSAVAYAAKRAGRSGKVIVAYASGSPEPGVGVQNASPPREDAMRRKVLDALLIHSGDVLRDMDFELAIVAGRPAKAIAALARERNADEIAVGARGAAPGQAAPDSVSRELRQIADRPVMVVP
jgi:nucleotide-binding universal stress UspA family protein